MGHEKIIGAERGRIYGTSSRGEHKLVSEDDLETRQDISINTDSVTAMKAAFCMYARNRKQNKMWYKTKQKYIITVVDAANCK